MRLARVGRELRLEQGRNVETVRGGFDGANFALRSTSHYREARFHGGPFVVGIDLEVTKEFFHNAVLRIERLQIRSGAQTNFRDGTGQLGRALGAIGDSARYLVDDNIFRSRLVFGAVRVFDSQHV